ncbi:hypothetical protein [Oricola sp.]|uniref:hypothetical protein n=1 Tax=Oricola sp. TaxID=1979950 RepID=UPI0025DBAD3D|nr:hypothetical protein [Oricola sp.]MCI5078435.1 hypothetical protein [Oricola sp.]
MHDPLFEIETWRGRWFFKYGSHYTGPFGSREAALLAARREAAKLAPRWRRSVPTSKAGNRSGTTASRAS